MSVLPIADARATTALAWALVRRHRTLLALGGLAFLGAGVCGVVPPWLFGRIVDAVRAGDADRTVTVAAVLIAGTAVLAGLLTAAANALLARATEPALADLREQVLAQAFALDGATLEETGAGDLLSRVGDDVRTVTTALTEVVPWLVQSALAVLLTAAGLFALDWRLGFAGLVAAPCYVGSLRWYLPRSAPLYAEERIAQGERAEALITGLHASPTLRAHAREAEQLARIAETSDRTRAIAVTVYRLLTRFFARNNGSELVGLLSLTLVGFFLVREDAVSVGAVTAAALYFHRLFNPIGALLYLFDDVQSAGASLARLAGVAVLPSAPAATADPAPAPVLALRGVGHAYAPGHDVLAGITLDLAPGEHVAVVGASGAGKTTLGAIASGSLAPTAGTVHLGGVPLGATEVREHVVLVTQEVHVFTGTVSDNLRLAAPGADDAMLRAVLEAVGAQAWVAALPAGAATEVGDGAHPLTTAQVQQLALARALLRDPAVVVLDEATAEAGSSGARVLDASADVVLDGRSALVIAHRLTQSLSADRVVVLDRGVVVEEGSHADLVAAGGRYAELWRAWSTG